MILFYLIYLLDLLTISYVSSAMVLVLIYNDCSFDWSSRKLLELTVTYIVVVELVLVFRKIISVFSLQSCHVSK